MGLDNPIHIAFLLILLLLVFGAKRLPEMGRSLGDGMRGFKDALGGESTQQTTAQAVAQPAAQPVLSAQQGPVAAIAAAQDAAPVHSAAQPAREMRPAA